MSTKQTLGLNDNTVGPQTDETPAKYRATARCYEKRSWLYERYWSDVLTVEEIAARTDASTQTIIRNMEAHGIPRRPPSACHCETPEDVATVYRDTSAPTTRGAETPQTADWSTYA